MERAVRNFLLMITFYLLASCSSMSKTTDKNQDGKKELETQELRDNQNASVDNELDLTTLNLKENFHHTRPSNEEELKLFTESMNIVKQSLTEQTHLLQACFQTATQNDESSVNGRSLEMYFALDRNGNLKKVEVEGDHVPSLLKDCLKETIFSLRFPQLPQSRDLVLKQVIRF